MKRFLTSPLAVLVLAGAAALLPIGYRLFESPAPGVPEAQEDVLDVLRSPTLAPSHDVAFWTRLRSADRKRFDEGLAYCSQHPDRPNCPALRTSSWLNALHQDADRAREGYLAAGSATATPEP